MSNPPSIDPALRHEPRHALVARGHGLAHIAQMTAGARTHLRPGGALFVEHGHSESAAVRRLFADAALVDSETLPDLAGCPRVTLGRARLPETLTPLPPGAGYMSTFLTPPIAARFHPHELSGYFFWHGSGLLYLGNIHRRPP
ncbi:hypothetical protein [Salinisphaera sp. LB1]|uniref:hypothetical protein n=1 Tax=Salinisphaera sp. LB1 TaxID=2183911 RepID=UPI0011AB7B36|nr:hypothetical protein [Salinisphaera sp. LB1]